MRAMRETAYLTTNEKKATEAWGLRKEKTPAPSNFPQEDGYSPPT